MVAKVIQGFFIITMFIGVYTPIYSQWTDDFSDNEFLSNPEWVGNISDFAVEGEILRLNAPAITNSSYLSTISNISLEATWGFTVKLDFNPSSGNYSKVYIMSDTEDLNNVRFGYVVKIGGTPDEISLYKVLEGVEILLIDGVDGRVDLSQVEVSVEVIRDAAHNWELRSKLLGEVNFYAEGSVTDLEIKTSSFFGVYCKYTSTRSTKFYFDNILVDGDAYVDLIAPTLLGYSTPSNKKIQLRFNEALDTIELKTSQFFLNGSISPIKINLLSVDTLLLEFGSEIALINSLELTEVSDLANNTLDTLLQIAFVDPSPYNYRDVVINEILADPTPQEGLPDYEFVELLNISDRIIDLYDWVFSDGSKIATLGSALLFPDSMLIICPTEAFSEYADFGNAQGLSSWPTLNNSGDALKIISKNGKIIDSLTYSSNWYKNAAKDDGGWSLEQINPTSSCLGGFNWVASSALLGGTPGQINTVYNQTIDTEPPIILHALLTDTLIELLISEPVVPKQYQATLLPSLEVTFFEVLSPSEKLSLYIMAENKIANSIQIQLEDCNSNNGLASSLLINIGKPTQNDIIINEVLFDPYAGGKDFVELFNTSNTYFNLKGLSIGNEEIQKIITDTTLLIPPQYYLAISEDILFMKNEYLAPDSSLYNSDLPSMPNEEGILILKTNAAVTLDSIFYSEDFHFSLISDTEGISLERISSLISGLNSANWRSAAESTRFATPGYENSQSSEVALKGKITVFPEIITPNNDGQADFCQIGYTLDGQSQTISITVYTINGQLIKTIAKNALISPAGFFTWDGTDIQGGMLPTAHYIIVSEIIRSDGRVLTFRNKIVVANGF